MKYTVLSSLLAWWLSLINSIVQVLNGSSHPHQSFSLHFICRKLEFFNFDIKIIRILKALVRKDLHLSVIEKVLLTSVTMSCGVNLAKVHWSTPALIIKLFPHAGPSVVRSLAAWCWWCFIVPVASTSYTQWLLVALSCLSQLLLLLLAGFYSSPLSDQKMKN